MPRGSPHPKATDGELSPEDLLARAPLWEALADLWLDTELADYQFDYIARAIAASPYSLEEALAIHDEEVAPAVSANLLSVAGEWAGFDSAWLNERCRHFASRRHSPWHRARVWMLRLRIRYFTGSHWPQIIERVEKLRSADEAEEQNKLSASTTPPAK